MAAALLRDLILDVYPPGPCSDHRTDGPGDVEGATPTCIDVDEQRHIRRVGDAPNVVHDVVQRCHAQIRQTIGRICDPAAGKIDGAISDSLGHHGGIGVDRAHDLQRVLFRDGVPQARTRTLACAHRHQSSLSLLSWCTVDARLRRCAISMFLREAATWRRMSNSAKSASRSRIAATIARCSARACLDRPW